MLSKKEEQLLKVARKLNKITKKYLTELDKIDKIMQKMPRQMVSCYNLEDRYFKHIPIIASKSINLELLESHLTAELPNTESMIPGITIYSKD